MEADPVQRFWSLFRGRMDVVGTNEGRCIRLESATEERWLAAINAHLHGTNPIGIYPFMPDGTVTWGCVDFDEGEEASAVYARNLQAMLKAFGIKGWIERSRSKGYHVWVFPMVPIEAATMRRALLAACQLVKAPTKEINPKQESLPEGKVGNYVRLPYPHSHTETGRQIMVEWPDDSHAYAANPQLDAFLYFAENDKATHVQLEALAQRWTPPPKPTPIVSDRPAWTGGGVPPYVQSIIDGGILEANGDRSDWLWRLCCIMVERSVDIHDAWPALQDADWKHGKFMARGDERHLRDMLDKAYR